VAGREVDAIGLVREIENDTLLFDNSGGGVTLTGGEPLYQPAFLRELLIQSRERGIHTAIETSGYASTRAFESIIDLVDLFLFDVKLLDDEKHRKYTGVSNGIIKENLTTVVAVKKAGSVILRFPVITGINDTDENVEGFLDFAGRLDGVTEVDLLPYHDVAEKYERLGLRYRMEEHSAPSEEKLSLIKERFEQAGFRVGLRG
jgi:pyruvate formate lyase activating enzyme